MEIKMKIEGDKVVIDKEEFLATCLSLGLAINILEDNSIFSTEEWRKMLAKKGSQQLKNIKKNSPQDIDRMLDEIAEQLNA